MSCLCQSCGKQYGVDIIVLDEIWEKIKPKKKPMGSGMLCASCIGKRLENTYDYSSFHLTGDGTEVLKSNDPSKIDEKFKQFCDSQNCASYEYCEECKRLFYYMERNEKLSRRSYDKYRRPKKR